RPVALTFGLATLAARAGGTEGTLTLSVEGSFAPGGEFTVLALVGNPKADQTVTLRVPDGLKIVKGESEQKVPPLPKAAAGKSSPVTWRLSAERAGTYTIRVDSSTGANQDRTITIRKKRPDFDD